MQNKTVGELRKLLSNNKKQAPSCAPFSKMKKADLIKYVAMLGLQDTPALTQAAPIIMPRVPSKKITPMMEEPMIEAKVAEVKAAEVKGTTSKKKIKPVDALINELTALKNEMGPFDMFKAQKGRKKKHFAYVKQYGEILEKYKFVKSDKADKIAREIGKILEQQQEYLNV